MRLAYNFGFQGHELNKVFKIVSQHEQACLREWQRHAGRRAAQAEFEEARALRPSANYFSSKDLSLEPFALLHREG